MISLVPMAVAVGLTNGALAAVGLQEARAVAASPTVGRVGVAALRLAGVAAAGTLVCSWMPFWSRFGVVLLGAWLLFVHAPLWCAWAGWGARRSRVGVALLALATALAAVAVDAFLVEPRSLEVSRVELAVAGLEQPVTVALVADLQTNDVGPWEARALAAVTAAHPDLVVFAGDYVQAYSPELRAAELARLRELLIAAGVHARLGAWAVDGDIDRPGWTAAFEGTLVHAVPESRTVDLGPLLLTLLAVEDSRAPRPPVPRTARPHLVVGHAPDFSLFLAEAGPNKVLLAGHTHGGQVRLPGIGPLLTLSSVPRAHAAGVNRLRGGAWLVVSRGVGMERDLAPRLRFHCRPEIVLLTLRPDRPLAGPHDEHGPHG